MKISASLTFLLVSRTLQQAGAGRGGGGSTTAATPSPSACVAFDLDDMFEDNDLSCKTDSPLSLFIDASNTQGPCPSSAVTLCANFTGNVIDLEIPAICSDTGSQFDLEVEVNLNTYAEAVNYGQTSFTNCTEEAENFIDYLNSQYDTDVIGGWGYICSDGSTCPSNFREGGRSLIEENSEIDMLNKTCGNFDYEAFVYVSDHFYGLAVPSEEAQKAGCPYMAAHAIIGDRHDPTSTVARKEVKTWYSEQEFEEYFPKEGSLPFGVFRGSEFVAAYNAAEATNSEGATYDVITNSCGHFMVNLAKELDIEIDSGIIAFVARRLMEHAGQDLIAKMRSSVNFPSLFSRAGSRGLRADALQDKEMLEKLISNTASGIVVN